ncbi:MAG: hypothetical protein NTV79_04535, partial [Candidatus Aureabacteria bacterium]|nr:hypothetical protein [Candidatus Auribacterota bacterium]
SRWREKIRFSDQQSLQEGEHEGIPFVEFRPTGVFPFSSAYAFSGDCLLFLVSPLRAGDQLAEALALVRKKGRGASLASLPGFQGMSGSLPAVSSPRLFCYLRTDRLAALWGGGALVGIEAPGVKEWQGLEAHLRQRIGVTRALGGAVWLKQGLRGWLRRELDLEKVKEIYGEKLLSLWRPPSRRFAALRFAPADAAGVWAGTGDFPLLWERARIEWRMLAPLLDESARNDLEGAKREMARAVETDLLPWLGDEAAILLNRLASPGLLPLPDAALAIRVKDEAAAARGVEKLVAAWIGSRPIVPVKSRRGGREITSLPVAPFFQPAWTLAEGYLIAGTSAATVEKTIGLFGKEGGGLLQDRDFERVTAVVPPEGERFLYLAAARLGDEVAQIVRWWASLTTAKGEGGGGETLLSPEEVIGTLQPWGRLKALAIRARTQQNIVIEDFYWYSEEESFSGGVSGKARQR